MTRIDRKKSDQPLKCILAGNKTNVHIAGATSTDSSGKSQNLTIPADRQSVTMPLGALDTFVVTVIVDGLSAGPSPELRAADDNTLLDLFEDPATLAAQFELGVIQ